MHIIDFSERHFPALISWFSNEAEVIQWGGPDLCFPLDDTQLMFMLEQSAGTPPQRWLFSALVEGEMAAHAQVALDWSNGVARLGRVAVNPAWRGQRIAIPFLSRLVTKVFAEPEFERLELNVYTFNQRAINIYTRLGFIPEGVRRSSVKVGNQRWDTAIYAMLRQDLPSGNLPSALGG